MDESAPFIVAKLPEDKYDAATPQNYLLRFWLSATITRSMAEQSMSQGAPPGSFIVRRSESQPGNYAVTVVEEGPSIQSYKVTDLGLGQVGVSTGQAFASLEYMLEFYYDKPFPEPSPTAVTLQYMHQHIAGLSGPDAGFGAVPDGGQTGNQDEGGVYDDLVVGFDAQPPVPGRPPRGRAENDLPPIPPR